MFVWLILVISGVSESVWATALGKSEGLTKLWPDVVFVVGMVISMAGLAYSMREIPTSTAYAVWVGIGAALTVTYAMITKTEPVSLARILLIIGLVACVVGLKIVH
ncbi:MAG: multidrug efflux SMR transporter [Bifidobacterium sp.]|uniref:Multidrug efflux SMR transporter n=1 Tax=Bifidobacterium fermentum TaxID=3059035 RepID=A0AB39UJT9_9BIFI